MPNQQMSDATHLIFEVLKDTEQQLRQRWLISRLGLDHSVGNAGMSYLLLMCGELFDPLLVVVNIQY